MAVVGCGAIAISHLRALRQLNCVDVVAVCDTNDALARRSADAYHVPSVYTDITELLANTRLDAVHVTTPPKTHASICDAALTAGAHVLVEKPVVMTIGELDHMRAVADVRGLQIGAVHNGLYQRAFARALKLVASGEIGRIRAVHIADHMPVDYDLVRNPAHWCHSLPGGVFGEMLPHDVYLADALVPGLEMDAISMDGPGFFEWLHVDRVCALLRSDSAAVTIEASVQGRSWNKTVDIIGTEGSLRIDRMCDVITHSRPNETWQRRAHLARVGHGVAAWVVQSGTLAAARTLGYPTSGHATLIRAFYSSLDGGETPCAKADALTRITHLYEMLVSAVDKGPGVTTTPRS